MNCTDPSRRKFLAYFSSLGVGSTLLPGVLWSRMLQQEGPLTVAMIREAEKVAGLSFSEEERELMVRDLNGNLESFQELRRVQLDNHVFPALHFSPLLPGNSPNLSRLAVIPERVSTLQDSEGRESLAFLPVAKLASLIRQKKMSSEELTRLYLNRLKQYGPELECVVTLTEELALRQARAADEDLAAGRYHGPLHGIPWGAKDLLATGGYKTTWGARPFQDQHIETDATVVERLEKAGAVLVAKLTLGALAWGDVWFGGKTKNPWDLKQGSSGSSAGSAAATSAGLVPFAIGSETLGSIVSPCTRCGVTGLRPTFGRVSRHGAMTLSWSMDKIGPICRTVDDCALVLQAIHGADDKDPAAVTMPFRWKPEIKANQLRVGYLKQDFEREREEDQEWRLHDLRTLRVLEELGFKLVPITLPDYPVDAASFILNVEAAAAFDVLTRNNQDDLMVRQIRRAWPNVFRQSRLVPAVEYIQANRVRTLVMQAMEDLFSEVDLYVAPSFVGNNLTLTNLTGHPCVVVPNGFTSEGHPTSICFIGNLYNEATTMAIAGVYQQATGFHLRHPPRFAGIEN